MSTTSDPTTVPTDTTDPTLSDSSTTTTTTETPTGTEDPTSTTPSDTPTTTEPTDTPTSTTDPPTTPPPTNTRPPTTSAPPTTLPPGTSTSISYGSSTISLPGGGVTTIVTSVIVIDGKTVTTQVPGPTQTSTGGGGNNNIGTIVGASVGGAIAVALIGLLWFILARKARERRHKAYENDIFNPDHGTRGPNFDLGGGPDPETIPDPYQLEPQQMQQHQYPGYNGYPAPIATGGYAATGPAHPLSPYGSSNPHYDAPSVTSSGTTPGLAGVGAAGALGAAAYTHNRHSGTPTTGDGSSGSADHASVQPLTARQAKEREAFARSQRMPMPMPGGPAGPGSPVLAPGMLSPTHTGNASNAAYNYGMGPAPPTTSSVYSTDSGAPGSPIRSQHGHAQAFPGGFGVANPDQVRSSTPGGGVVVHQDAGRVPQHEEHDGHEEGEIPPTYDSIPVDDRPRAAAASAEPPRPLSAASGGQPSSIGETRAGSETDQRPHAI